MVGINLSTFLYSDNPVDIGCQYEDQTRYVYFDLSPLVELYGDGTFEVYYKHFEHDAHKMTDTSRVLNYAKAILTQSETLYSGYGEIELIFYPTVTTGSISDNYHLPKVKTIISPSLLP